MDAQLVRRALATTAGTARGDGYEIDFGGACPVQGFGLVDGLPCYFRARGNRWSFEVFAADDEAMNRPATFEHDGASDGVDEYAASWMPTAESVRHIAEAIAAFRASLSV